MKCLIVEQMHESLLPMMAEIGVLADYQPQISPEEVLQIISSYDGIMVRSKMNLDQHFFEKATSLKFVARAGAGMDKIDVAAAIKNNILLMNAPEGNSNALAEQALAMLLSLMNNLANANLEVKSKVWNREANRGYELSGKRVGIIGYGHMGKAFAYKLSLLGCQVMAFDKYKNNFGDEFVSEVSLKTLQLQCDIISIHIPLDSANKYFINKNFFDNLAHPIWFINTSRGEVVDTASLINALQEGKVKGAALDVLENENLASLTAQQTKDFDNLVQANNVILSPHIGGWTFESYKKINQVLVAKILDYKNSLL